MPTAIGVTPLPYDRFMDFNRMVQKAAGVPDAIAADRRDIAMRRLIRQHARAHHGLDMDRLTDAMDDRFRVVSRVVAAVQAHFERGGLDDALISVDPAIGDEWAVLQSVVSAEGDFVSIPVCRAIIASVLELFVAWARSHPDLDDDSLRLRV